MAKKKASQKKVEEPVVEIEETVEETVLKNYVIVEGQKSGEVAIKLLNPAFEKCVFQLGKIGIKEEDGRAILAFDYDIISGEIPTDAHHIDVLENELGDAVVDLLENHFDEGEVVGGDD
jgi:riboflavin synthase